MTPLDPLSPALAELASLCGDYYAAGAPHVWPSLLANLPDRHVWEYSSAETLGYGTDTPATVNTAARATFEDVEALAVMLAWKNRQLLDGAVRALNDGSILVAAAAIRSAIEAAAALTDVVHRALRTVEVGAKDPVAGIDELGELSDYVAKCLWGGRAEGRNVASTNVLTQLSRIEKRTVDPHTQHVLTRKYGELCDVVHPSAGGHQAFWNPPVQLSGSALCVRLR